MDGKRRTEQLVNPVSGGSRYDDVYYEGLKWLNSLAVPPLKDGELPIPVILRDFHGKKLTKEQFLALAEKIRSEYVSENKLSRNGTQGDW
ncbi:MAG: hypothetical protein KAJ10_05365 [Thermodesulfovibrionia bacterium]|nr:hypothetical protein [Thermodesulfovibrionia bacterium]